MENVKKVRVYSKEAMLEIFCDVGIENPQVGDIEYMEIFENHSTGDILYRPFQNGGYGEAFVYIEKCDRDFDFVYESLELENAIKKIKSSIK